MIYQTFVDPTCCGGARFDVDKLDEDEALQPSIQKPFSNDWANRYKEDVEVQRYNFCVVYEEDVEALIRPIDLTPMQSNKLDDVSPGS
ncbi:hypothetical protein FF1_043975 [Malus domestica]